MHSNGVRNLVFLGGSCNPTTWRTEIACPFFDQAQICYYNPQKPDWRPELIEEENRAKDSAGVLLFVIDNQTRAISAMIELAELSAGNRLLVVVLKELIRSDSLIRGQCISSKEYQELRHSQLVVRNLLERRGIPVFTHLNDALHYTTMQIKQHFGLDELIHQYTEASSHGLIKQPAKLVKLREIFRSLDVANVGLIRLPDVQYAFELITNKKIDEQMIRTVIFYQQRCSSSFMMSENNYDLRLNFEQFCCLIAIDEHQRDALYSLKTHSKSGHASHIGSKSNNIKLQSKVKSLKEMRDQNNMILRPLQWIFDFFSGAGNHHHPHHSHHHSQPTHQYHQTSPSYQLSSSNRAYNMSQSNGYDVPDGAISRSRTPVQRLDSVQSTYANQISYNLSPGDLVIVPQISSPVVSSRTTAVSTDCGINLSGARFLQESKSANLPQHVYPYHVECRDIYLGGSGFPSRWREEIAIPMLRKQHLTFYYQYENSYNENISPFEASAILNSRILLFVITSDLRSLSSMLTAAHFIAKGYSVILCVQYIGENAIINGEMIPEDARKDYNRGREYLVNLAARYSVPVFKEIHQAVNCANDKIKQLNRQQS